MIPCSRRSNTARVAHQRLVMTNNFETVLQFPTETTKVLETHQIPAEIGTLNIMVSKNPLLRTKPTLKVI